MFLSGLRAIAPSYKQRERDPTWHSEPVLIETERLRIRDWNREDAPAAPLGYWAQAPGLRRDGLGVG
jgi:hypothetical protein